MSLDKKKEKFKKITIGRKKKIQPIGGKTAPQMVAEIAERSSTLSEVTDRVKQEYDIDITIPTVTSYLKAAWGKKYGDKKKDMSIRRRERKRWSIEYGLARQNVGDIFKEDWLSTDDGLFYNFDDSTLVSLPRVEDRAYRSKNIINYSKSGDFGWTPDKDDPDALGTADQRILGIVTRQLNRRIDGQIEERKRALIREKAMERLKGMRPEDIEIENLSKIIRENTRLVKKELSEEIKALEDEKADIFVAILQQLGKGDDRTRTLHGRDMIRMEDGRLASLELDPAYASSDKKFRGRQRMLAEPDEVFGRASYNIPFLLWCHAKRIQVHCISEDSEILTRDGWKGIDSISYDDWIATLVLDDQDNHVLNYQEPTEIITSEYEGPMVSIQKGTLDVLVTPNHKMFVGRRGGSYKGVNYDTKWDFVEASELINKTNWIIPRSVNYQTLQVLADDASSFVQLGHKWDAEGYLEHLMEIDTSLWYLFMGVWIGDGNIWSQPENSKYLVSIAAPKEEKFRQEKIEIIDKLCKALNISYQVREHDIQVWSKPLYEKIAKYGLGKSINRFIPENFLYAPSERLQYLFNGLMMSDGHYGKDGVVQYSTSSEKLRDDFQELCLKLGYVAISRRRDAIADYEITDRRGVTYKTSFKESWNISIATKCTNARVYTDDINIVPYKGRIWCVTVPNHTIYVRRNGKPYWTGNSHNLAKQQPELLKPEPPKVPAKYNDVPGINARVRFPKNLKEYVHTQEAGMIVTKDFAEKFRYFTVVEEGTLITEDLSRFPKAWRVNKAMRNHAEYKRIIDMAEDVYPIDRLDPLTLGGFEEIGYGVGNKFAKHSGELFLVGQPKKRRRKITLAQGEVGKEKDHIVEVEYYSQKYQIVREDTLRVGDKLLDRHGIKGIISEIVGNLGRNEKREPYDLIVNYDEVWREADRSTSEGILQDDTFIKQGKKKSGIVMEHEAGDGQIFFFLIDKFAQDGTTTGLRFSPTLVNGLWERALDTLEDDTVYNRDMLIDSFASSYFRGEGNLVSTLKALHYKAVKENGVVRIEIDDKEPTPDEKGEVINLPHTYAGHTYNTAYVPFSVARVYHDGSTFREIYIAQQANTPNDASDFYWFNIMKQTKNRFSLFPKMEWGIQLVTRPWAEDPKDPTKCDKVQMDYLDVIDMGGDPYDPNLKVTFRKEPVTSGDSIQTHPVEVDFTSKTRSTIGLNPTIGLKATIDYDGDQVVVFVPPITDAISTLNKEELAEVKALKKRKFDETFEGLYDKARNITYAGSEEELGVYCAAYNQQIAETENELIERLGGLRKRAMILQSKELPPVVTIGEGTKYEESQVLDIATINKITDVEKILKMREPRWKVRKLEKKKIEDLTLEEWELVRDTYLRKKLNKIINVEIKDPGVRKLYDLIREPSEYMQREFMGKSGEIDPIGLKLDTRNRLLDRILWNEIRASDVYVDLDAV